VTVAHCRAAAGIDKCPVGLTVAMQVVGGAMPRSVCTCVSCGVVFWVIVIKSFCSRL